MSAKRSIGPVLFRTSKELRFGEDDEKLCFLTVFGLYRERAVLVHCVEPRSLSVSLLPLGEAELQHLLNRKSSVLLSKWLTSRSNRMSRDDWAAVSEWLLSQLVLKRARVVRDSTVETLPNHFVVALTDTQRRPELTVDQLEIEEYTKHAYGQLVEGIEKVEEPLDAFRSAEYDRLKQTALVVGTEENSLPSLPLPNTPAPPERNPLSSKGSGVCHNRRNEREDGLVDRIDKIEAVLLEKLAIRAAAPLMIL